MIRKIKPEEIFVLDDFLCEAIYIPEGMEAPSKDIIKQPDLQVYAENLGERDGDICYVAGEDYRRRGIAGKPLNMAVDDLNAKGISPVYPATDHTDVCERYNWGFLCMVQKDDEPEMTIMYIHR